MRRFLRSSVWNYLHEYIFVLAAHLTCTPPRVTTQNGDAVPATSSAHSECWQSVSGARLCSAAAETERILSSCQEFDIAAYERGDLSRKSSET